MHMKDLWFYSKINYVCTYVVWNKRMFSLFQTLFCQKIIRLQGYVSVFLFSIRMSRLREAPWQFILSLLSVSSRDSLLVYWNKSSALYEAEDRYKMAWHPRKVWTSMPGIIKIARQTNIFYQSQPLRSVENMSCQEQLSKHNSLLFEILFI